MPVVYTDWWGWLFCMVHVMFSTGSKWPQSFTFFSFFIHCTWFNVFVFYLVLYQLGHGSFILSCEVTFPYKTARFCIILSVTPTCTKNTNTRVFCFLGFLCYFYYLICVYLCFCFSITLRAAQLGGLQHLSTLETVQTQSIIENLCFVTQ